MHDDELSIDTKLARSLIAEQYPDRAGSSIRRLETAGTVNAIFRIDDDLAARLPFRATDASVVKDEAAASAAFASVSTVSTPRLIHLGAPTEAYPSAWTIHTWMPGEAATVDTTTELAADLVHLIRTLRAVDTGGRQFNGTGRGGQLTDHDTYLEEAFDRSAHLIDVSAASKLWRALRETPRAESDVMSHSDLIPGNLLVHGGRLTGVLDAGGYGPADPALDLIVFWHLFDAPIRESARALMEADDNEWRRAAAWALQQSMGLAWYYEHSNPAMSDLGQRTIERLLGDPTLGL